MSSEAAVETDLPVLQLMIDSITDYAVIRLDAEGRVRSWHPGAERLTGYRAAEIVGHPVTVFNTEDDVRTGLAERELAAAAREGPWSGVRDQRRARTRYSSSPVRR